MTGIMLSPDSLDATKMQLTVGGTAGVDSISFLPAPGGKISVNMNGHVSGPFAVNGRLVALGQAGNDLISVNSAIKLPAYLYGGGGNNQLIGGSGDNVLVGGAGTNMLIGGTAHNLIIAGTGPATLYSTRQGMRVGSTSGSILVGGSTDFDQNDVALATIIQEWGSSDAYATRISKIKGGTLAGGVALTSTTVQQPPTHVVDQLFASTGWDWFVAPSKFDQLFGIDTHKKPAIQIN
jgi:Ca2+-binding RTX toxin-like protein